MIVTAPVSSLPANPVMKPLMPVPMSAGKPTTAAAAPTSTNHLPPAQVQALVEKHCGKDARGVVVAYRPDGILEVRVEVMSAAMAEKMVDRITTIPELGPQQLKVKIDVAR
jgi:hypothetical protein